MSDAKEIERILLAYVGGNPCPARIPVGVEVVCDDVRPEVASRFAAKGYACSFEAHPEHKGLLVCVLSPAPDAAPQPASKEG